MKKFEKTIFSDEYRNLIDEMVSIRHKKALTQRDLAKKLEINHSILGSIEIYERRMDISEFVIIMKAMDVPKKKILEMVERFIDKV